MLRSDHRLKQRILREAVGMSNRQGKSYGSLRVDVERSRRMSEMTIAYYDRMAEAYWDALRITTAVQTIPRFLMRLKNIRPISFLILGSGLARASALFLHWAPKL